MADQFSFLLRAFLSLSSMRIQVFLLLGLLAACQNLHNSGIIHEGVIHSPPPTKPETNSEIISNPPDDGIVATTEGTNLQQATLTPETESPVINTNKSEWDKVLEPYLDGNIEIHSPPIDDEILNVTPPLLPLKGGAARVGILLPLSGQTAPLGRSMLNAAQMAMFDFADMDFELLPHDTAGRPEDAAFAATIVIGDQANLLIGPLLADSVHAVSPITRAAHVPVIAFSSDRTVAGDGVYTMGFLPENEIERVVTYALKQGLTRFAALAPRDAYGQTVVSALSSTVARFGGTIVELAYYHPSGDDIELVVRELANYDDRRSALNEMRQELLEKEDELSKNALERLSLLETLGDLPFDALLIADGGDRLQRVAAMLPFFDIDPQKIRVLGTGQWDIPGIGAEPALMGAWFAAPPPRKRQSFERRYHKLYGMRPPRLATLAYDAMALAAVLARGDAMNPYNSQAITQQSGYAGRDGIFRFNSAGTTERGLSILEVRQRENIIIDEAPTGFSPTIN